MDNKVIFNTEDAIKIDEQFISFLKKTAENNESKKVTFCLHKTHEDGVHEMINVYPKGLYVRPHKHPIKTETKHMIEGRMLMFIYDDLGHITYQFELTETGLGGCLAHRIEKDYYHSIVPISDIVVFHEIINGPYTGINDSVFPDWAPEIHDQAGIEAFIAKITRN